MSRPPNRRKTAYSSLRRACQRLGLPFKIGAHKGGKIMADEADYASDQQQRGDAYREAAVRAAAAAIPAGVPGECSNCGEHMPRLVDGRCAPCRDGRRRVPLRRP